MRISQNFKIVTTGNGLLGCYLPGGGWDGRRWVLSSVYLKISSKIAQNVVPPLRKFPGGGAKFRGKVPGVAPGGGHGTKITILKFDFIRMSDF